VTVIKKKVTTRTTAMTNTYGLHRKETPASSFNLQKNILRFASSHSTFFPTDFLARWDII